jgi:hypothetical protein
VDLETKGRRKRYQRVRARVMLFGDDILTGDSSRRDESIDGWNKTNGATKRRRRTAECAALPEINRAHGSTLVGF